MFHDATYLAMDLHLARRSLVLAVGEIAQLYVEDIEKINGVWGVHIAVRFPGQRLKNRNSWRFVPLHSKLLALGLVAYRDQVVTLGHQHLFPGLTWGDEWTRGQHQ